MKKISYTLILWCLVALFPTSLHAQILVNKAWQDTTGNPKDTLQLQFAEKDGSSNLVTLGNTYATNDSEQLLITKYTYTGSVVWQIRVPSPTTKRLVATNLDISNGYIYVASTAYDSTNSKSTFVTDKISDTLGTIIWAKQYTPSFTGYAVPAAVREDSLGNVYVAGTEQVSSTTYEMTVLKYNSAGTVQWTMHLDSTGLYTGAVGMSSIGKDNTFAVTGYSGSTFSTWDIVTLYLNSNTGSVNSTSRVSNGSGSFISHPVALAKDNSGETYIVGASEISGSNIDIKMIKYDSLFNQIWVKTYGNPDSLADIPSYMVLDGSHNVITTGYTTQATGEIDLLITKFDKNGNFVWSRTFNNGTSGIPNAQGNSITVDDSNDIYVTGQVYDGNNWDIITIETDPNGNVLWQKIYDAGGGSNDVGANISLDNSNNVYIAGTTGTTTTKYITMQYTQWNRNQQLDTNLSGYSVDVKNEIVIRFDESVFNSAFTQNLDLVYGSPAQVFTSAANTTLLNKLYKTFGSSKLVRVFRGLSPQQKTTKSRLGETISIPDFWTTYVLVMPSSASMTTAQVCDSLKTLFPLVRYSMQNYTAQQFTTPNDYDYSEQYNLHPGGGYDSADINIQPAWGIEMGQPFVKVGVLDGGLNWQHSDFGYTAANPNSGRVVNGWDFQHQGPLRSFIPGVSSQDDPHGNGMAGILGAVTNDSGSAMYSCISGIAGGFFQPNTSYDTGVSIYGLTIFQSGGGNDGGGTYLYSSLDYLTDAIVEASIDSASPGYKFGLNVMNNSWGLDYTNAIQYTGYNVSILNDAVHFANRAKVIFVAARGNNGNDSIVYPACYDDDWVINVGGTGTDGKYYGTGSLASSIGGNIDVSAPADATIIHSLSSGGICETIGATSAATAHVSGVAALMVSYLDSIGPSYNNLAPEDVEFVIQKTATLIGPTYSYSDSTGYGRLNAGAALTLIEKPYRHLYHFGSDNFSNTKSHSLYATNDSIYLTEPWPTYDSTRFASKGYRCDVWKMSATVNHTLASTDSILYYWQRNSSSTPFALLDANDNLAPHEKVFITSLSKTTAQLYGYVYHIYGIDGGYAGWLPFDTTLSNSVFDYSILTQNTTITDIKDVPQVESSRINVYPNPSNNSQMIVIENSNAENVSILLTDIEGRILRTCFTGRINPGTNQFTVDLNTLASGLYFYQIVEDNNMTVKKIIKM